MTAARIEVPFWPTSSNNLSWSADNLIAVGGGESIAILVPRLDTKGPNNLPWDIIVHRINLFSTIEIPFQEPLSSVNWSIGEELSLRHVTSLEWSPPGLASFGTCALAILHSNHVLALWECVGQPHIRDKWKRCLLINHAIQAYCGASSDVDIEVRQVRQRIRAFAWLPAVKEACRDQYRKLDSHLARTEQYLAASTDAGDMFILRVRSPYDILEPNIENWGAQVVLHFQLPSNSTASSEAFQHGVTEPAGATAIAFSDWVDNAHAILTYIVGGRLYTCDLCYEASESINSCISASESREHLLPLTPGLSGPIKFEPNSSKVIVFGPDAIVNVDVCATANSDATSHHLDGRWDCATGLAFTADEDAEPNVHIVSLLSTSSSGTTKLPLSLSDESDLQEPRWQQGLYENRANFSASFDLGDNVMERIWGMAASPLGEFVATCTFFLPSDSPAHVIESRQTSIVSITNESASEDPHLPVNPVQYSPHTISTEALVYSLRQYICRGGTIEDSAESRERVKHLIMSIVGLSEDDLSSVNEIPQPWSEDEMHDTEISSEQLQSYLSNMRAQLFYEPKMFHHRTDRLMEVVLQQQPKMQLAKEDYVHLAQIILSLPREFSEAGIMSRKITAAYSSVKSRIELSGSSVDPDMTEFPSLIEECSICHQQVKFESLRWSRCTGGHQFTRCSLTFLSIMEPGISKSCRLCRAAYLNEHALPDLKAQHAGINGVQNGEPRNSLARLLFAACNRCILCGGKFVA